MKIADFIKRWEGSGGAERANKDTFLNQLCSVLDVPPPNPSGKGDEDYVFERTVEVPREGGGVSHCKIDLYKRASFILEAKQGTDKEHGKIGTARRKTPGWSVAMTKAFEQAHEYAKFVEEPPPFIVVADIGYCFDLWASFDGSAAVYRQFPNPMTHRIYLKDLETHRELLRQIFLDPAKLNPAHATTRVTRDVAEKLASLARSLEQAGHQPRLVALFLMRCIFTMFAEDVRLLKQLEFTTGLKEHWLPNPNAFPSGVELLWRAMNDGSSFGYFGKLLRFNGGLFRDASALALDKAQLRLLLDAATCSWQDVEPAIFGTLLERALDPEERHKLGAHFTPRSYVERIVRPTLEEPLRAEWQSVQGSVRKLIEAGRTKPARALVHEFLAMLSDVRILDPACGSGNFLYVALDLLKTLEGEALGLLRALESDQSQFPRFAVPEVTPRQFLGLEVNPRAKEIAELVLWIGYLQWHFKIRGRDATPPEPVLQDYQNVQEADALLAYSRKETAKDRGGRPLRRWDGKSMMLSPATGKLVPDDDRTVGVDAFINPSVAPWPDADYIIGNPPFLGTKRMRAVLGDGYVDALRSTYAPDVQDNADYVMYWWHRAALAVESGKAQAFGFITTNSITQSFNRRVVRTHLDRGLHVTWAIPDHPWVDSETGAAVRIAMTSARGSQLGLAAIMRVRREHDEHNADGAARLEFEVDRGERIGEDLRFGANVAGAKALRANDGISGMGIALHGHGFVLEPDLARKLARPSAPATIRRYVGGKDLLQQRRERYVIDFSFATEEQARRSNPAAFQHVVDHVLPERRHNRRDSIRNLWWRFGWERPLLRKALASLTRYIATTETAKHRVFQFVDGTVLPDHMIIVVASDSAFVLGVLSSRVHVAWALAAGGTLEDRPRYNKNVCFDPFPFPAPTVAQRRRIGNLAEAIDSHRKERQEEHPSLTLTALYNVVENLRTGAGLSARDLETKEQGLASVLLKMHRDLDAAVLDAYGFDPNIADNDLLGKLAALNAERRSEEDAGLVRWIRPEYQKVLVQTTHPGLLKQAEREAWPLRVSDQVRAVKRALREKPQAEAKEIASSFVGVDVADVEEILAGISEARRPSSKPPPSVLEPAETNGSRLRARVLHADDGAAQFYGWHDSELDFDCYFQQTSDGQTRCIPATGGASGYFADPACTIPVVGVASCVAPGARYAYVSRAVGCSTVFDVHKIGAEVTGPTVYYGIAGCTPTGVGASAWFLDDGIEPPGSFVAAHESVD